MILIIAIIYIFSSSVIFDEQLKNTSRNTSAAHEKIHSPLFTHSPSPPKNSKSVSPPFLPTLKILQVAPLQKGGGEGVEDTMFRRRVQLETWQPVACEYRRGKEHPMIATQQPKLDLILIIKNIVYITVSLRQLFWVFFFQLFKQKLEKFKFMVDSKCFVFRVFY